MKTAIRTLLLAAGLACAAPAFAQDDASRAVARKLGYEGVEAYQEGDFKAAAEKLGRAYKILKAPSLGLWSARAFEKNGQLVEASERYLEVKRLPVSAGADTAVQERAKADAASEYETLQPRIPQLRVEVEGADAERIEITLDGAPMSSAMVGVARPANPGNRRVEGKLGSEVVAAWVGLKEGEEKSVTLRFGGQGAVIAKEEAGAGQAAAGSDSGDPNALAADRGAAPGFMHTTMPWIAFGIGGAGLVAGGVTAVMAIGKQSELDENCPDGCSPEFHDEADAYDSLRLVSTIGFVVGAVGAAGGVALLLTAPDQPAASAQSASVTPWLGIGSAGVRGRF